MIYGTLCTKYRGVSDEEISTSDLPQAQIVQHNNYGDLKPSSHLVHRPLDACQYTQIVFEI